MIIILVGSNPTFFIINIIKIKLFYNYNKILLNKLNYIIYYNKYNNVPLKNSILINIPKILINVTKNKLNFCILNHYYKNLLFFFISKNYKKKYNLKTNWLILLKKIKIILTILQLPITIIQYRWFYFIKNIYLYFFKSIKMYKKKLHIFKQIIKINNIMFYKLYIFNSIKTKKKRILKRKLTKKIFK